PDAIAEAALRHGCRSVAFTYNDPVIFHEYAIDVAKACHARGIKTVAVTAGYQCAEPRPAFYAPMAAAHADPTGITAALYPRGIKPVAVTAGYQCAEPRREFYAHMDAANVDLKGFTDDFYQRVCIAQLEPVLETLRYIKHETSTWLEITTLLIPGKNDSDAE